MAKRKANSKLIPEEVDQSQFQKDFSRGKKKIEIRQRDEQFEEEDMARLIGQASAKRKKVESNVKYIEFYKKMKQCDNLFKKLEEVTSHIEADYNIMKENKQNLEQMTKNKLKMLKDTHDSFQKIYERMESNNMAETEMCINNLDNVFKKCQDQLVTEVKRNSSWESWRRSFIQANSSNLALSIVLVVVTLFILCLFS